MYLKIKIIECIKQGAGAPCYPQDLKIKTKTGWMYNACQLLLIGFLLLFVFTGCDSFMSSKPSKQTPGTKPGNSPTSKKSTKASTSLMSENINGGKKKEPGGTKQDMDDTEETSDDGAGELDDMYFNIYGEENVSFKDGKPFFDSRKAYKDSLNIPKDKQKEAYLKKLEEAENLYNRKSYRESAKMFREALFIEKEYKLDSHKAKSRLKEIQKIMFKKAEELVKQGKYRDALLFSEIAVACNPSDGENLKLAGEIYANTGEEGLAIPYMATALKKDPKDYKLQYRLKTLYMLEGMPEEAIPLINPKSATYGRMKNHHEELAGAYLMIYIKSPEKRKELEPKIKKALKFAIESMGNSGITSEELKMNLALFNKNYKDAINHCKKMLSMDIPYPVKTRLIYNIALLSYLKGDKKSAYGYFKKTIDRVINGKGTTQGENYMAQMSCWFLDLSGGEDFTSKKSGKIYSRVIRPDHSYRQEYGYIREFLVAKEKKDYKSAIHALNKYTGKRHLEPVGYFVEDLLQVPAQKAMIYLSKGRIFDEAGDGKEAKKCYKIVTETDFLNDEAERR